MQGASRMGSVSADLHLVFYVNFRGLGHPPLFYSGVEPLAQDHQNLPGSPSSASWAFCGFQFFPSPLVFV